MGFSCRSRGGGGRRPEGHYLYGGVGRGKTMLLDLFFNSVHYAPKRRVHFQEFMAEAHEAIERGRKAAADPIASAAAEIASDAALLCFDEFEVTDIADAMILTAVPASLREQRGDRRHLEHPPHAISIGTG